MKDLTYFMNRKECKNIKHKLKSWCYHYACPVCKINCSKRKKPLKNGNWCECECNHNTLWCHICKSPVKKESGMYYFVKWNNHFCKGDKQFKDICTECKRDSK